MTIVLISVNAKTIVKSKITVTFVNPNRMNRTPTLISIRSINNVSPSGCNLFVEPKLLMIFKKSVVHKNIPRNIKGPSNTVSKKNILLSCVLDIPKPIEFADKNMISRLNSQIFRIHPIYDFRDFPENVRSDKLSFL